MPATRCDRGLKEGRPVQHGMYRVNYANYRECWLKSEGSHETPGPQRARLPLPARSASVRTDEPDTKLAGLYLHPLEITV